MDVVVGASFASRGWCCSRDPASSYHIYSFARVGWQIRSTVKNEKIRKERGAVRARMLVMLAAADDDDDAWWWKNDDIHEESVCLAVVVVVVQVVSLVLSFVSVPQRGGTGQ